MVDDAAALLSRRCNVFVATDLRSTRNIPSWSGYEARNQTVGVHYWLQSALQAHPWRVTDARKADVVFVNASFAYVPHSLLHAGLPAVLREAFSCSATGASPHHCASAAGLPTHSHSCRPLRFATGECSQQECSPRSARLAQAAEDGSSVVWVKDFVHRTSGAYWNTSNELVAPFVVYQPWWLVSARGASAVPAGYTTPWDERKLVFFAGHVPAPNLYSSLRWHLWRQIVHEGAQRATVRAADLYIYWPYSRCVDRSYYDGDTNSSQSLLSGFLTGFCERFCTRFPSQFLIADISGKPSCAAFLRSNRQSASEACQRLYAVGSSPVRKWQSRLRDRCPAFSRLNVSAELAAAGEEAVAPGRLGLEEYMREAMGHKFCIVSHGDDPTSHKLAETMAIAGVGGCLPLIIHSQPHAVHLPYAGEIDYCRVGFLLRPPHVANMHRMLGRLEGVDAREAAERHAVAAKLRTAFIQREGATLDQPSAAHYLVAAMCARAQRSQAVAECALHSGHELQDVAEHDSPGPGPAGAAGGANGRMPESCLPDYF